jgi:predicted ATPase/DNA-binding winged helix-turn-helix (wHTH) protein
MTAGLLHLGDRVVDLTAGVVTTTAGPSPLGPLEVTLLRYLADRAGRVVSRDDLQVDVWGISRTAQTRSIDVAISRLRKKLEVDPVNPKVLVTLHGSGYRLELAPAHEAAVASLPAEVDAFVGRARELATLADALAEHRLVTVLGPAGVGKTRLALQLARRAPLVVWCPLADAHDATAVASALALALGIQLRESDPRGQLARALASLGPCLVLFDNAEQVRGGVAGLVGELWTAAPQTRFLVTSQVALSIPAEVVSPLEVMAADGDGADLFTARARARQPGLDLDAGALARLVRDLDGLPLAIELAAARTRTLTLDELAARLGDRFAVLTGGRQGTRHETLWAALDGSWSVLRPHQRAAVCALSVLDGSFDTVAAEAVLAPLVQGSALDLLGELVDHSLLQRDRQAGRWSTLLSIRAFAREQCLPEDAVAARLRLADHLLTRYGGALQLGSPSRDLRAAMSADLGQLVRALEDAVGRGDGARAAALLGPTSVVLSQQGPLSTAAALTRRVLALPLSPAEQVVPALVRANLAADGVWGEGTPAAHFEAAAVSARSADARALAVRATCGWGRALGRTGDPAGGLRVLEEAVALARTWGLPVWEGTALTYLGWHYATDGGDQAAARDHLQRALAVLVGRGATSAAALAHAGLARVATTEGRFAAAARDLEQALALCAEDGDESQLAALRYNVANNLLQWGRADEAVPAARAAVTGARRTGSSTWLARSVSVLAKALIAADRPEEAVALDLPALANTGIAAGAAADLWHREGLARLETRALVCRKSGVGFPVLDHLRYATAPSYEYVVHPPTQYPASSVLGYSTARHRSSSLNPIHSTCRSAAVPICA